jgi:hypothetical protein
MQCSDMGLTVKPSTTYTITVDLSAATSVTCKAYETATPANTGTATRTTFIPASTITLGIHNGQTTLTAAAINYFIAKGELTQN